MADSGKLLLQILQVMQFGVFADLDETGIRCEKIGVAKIPEIGFVLQACIAQKLALAEIEVPVFVELFNG